MPVLLLAFSTRQQTSSSLQAWLPAGRAATNNERNCSWHLVRCRLRAPLAAQEAIKRHAGTCHSLLPWVTLPLIVLKTSAFPQTMPTGWPPNPVEVAWVSPAHSIGVYSRVIFGCGTECVNLTVLKSLCFCRVIVVSSTGYRRNIIGPVPNDHHRVPASALGKVSCFLCIVILRGNKAARVLLSCSIALIDQQLVMDGISEAWAAIKK